jgi:putative phosphoserine phosphatase/1-acylglycerol-3-phosphate O-acyltransferase
MGKAAAFFDLDRTLLLTASGPVLNDAMQAVGAVPSRGLPGQGLLYRSYDLLGESLPGMALARAAALAVRGRRRSLLLAAGERAADRLEQLVAPWAPAIMQEHREAGRQVVLATTTPYDLIEPLARRLGFDDVLATRYATTGDGPDARYTGKLDGGFVWAAGKLSAVRRWGSDHDVELADSWAYSDSVYDVPLLSAVGHPVAVNADVRLAAIAAIRRWPQINLDAPPGVPEVLGVEPMEVVRSVARPEMFPYARFDIAGTQHIPTTGPALVVANHRSYFDVPTLGLTVMKAGRIPRGMAKKELFDAPIVGQLARAFGQIMVDRSGGPTEAMAEAIKALRAGEVIVLTPEGTIPRGRDFFQTKLKGKTGAARLAAATQVPVIPVGIWGSEQVWPRSARLPNMTNLLHPPTVQVRVGPPVQGLTGAHAKADTETIMAAIVDLLPEEARQEREPTEEEIARATPPRH